MKGILIIDHGSMKEAANHMLECVGELVQRMAGDAVVVRVAHMELASPTIADGFAACVARGRDARSSCSRTCSRRASIPRATFRVWSRRSPRSIRGFPCR